MFSTGFFKRVLFTAVCVHFSLVNSYSANYYIDFKNGNDLNDGLSINKPFQHCPGDVKAAYIASRISLVPGDMVIFKGGVAYEGHIIVNWSGTSGNSIVYISGDKLLNRWGETSAIIDAQSVTLEDRYNAAISIRSNSYITIKGFLIKNVPSTGNDAYFGAIGWRGSQGGNIIIEDCTTMGKGGNGIMLQGCWSEQAIPPSNFQILNCNIGFSGGHGIHLRGGLSNVSIVNSLIHNNGRLQSANGIFAAAGGSGILKNLTVRGCEIFDNPTKGPMNLSGHDLLIENNFIYSTVQLSIGLTIAADFYVPLMSTRNVTIRNNVIDLDTRFEGAIRINIPAVTSHASQYNMRNIKIHNNTIIQRGLYYALYFDKRGAVATNAIDSVEVINNVIKNASGNKICIFTDKGTEIPNFKCRNNYYFSGYNPSSFVWAGKKLENTYWKTTHPGDFLQIAFDDPFPNIYIPSKDADYFPSSTSPLVDGGIQLPFSYDYFGQQRSGKWDIGAVEYSQTANYYLPKRVILVPNN